MPVYSGHPACRICPQVVSAKRSPPPPAGSSHAPGAGDHLRPAGKREPAGGGSGEKEKRKEKSVLAFLTHSVRLRSSASSSRLCSPVVACGIFSYRLVFRLVMASRSLSRCPVAFLLRRLGHDFSFLRLVPLLVLSSRYAVSSSYMPSSPVSFYRSVVSHPYRLSLLSLSRPPPPSRFLPASHSCRCSFHMSRMKSRRPPHPG